MCINKFLLAVTLSNPDLPVREKTRLRSVSSDNASRWLSAAPNSRSFKYFEDNQFSDAHSVKIKSRKANSEGKIQTSKGMLAFMPFACSSLGTLSLEAKNLLNAIASEMSLKHNSPRSLCLSRAVPRISTAIQQGNAFCLVNKMIDLKIYYSTNLQY